MTQSCTGFRANPQQHRTSVRLQLYCAYILQTPASTAVDVTSINRICTGFVHGVAVWEKIGASSALQEEAAAMLDTDGATKVHDSTMCGWLDKRPSSLSLKSWQQRWFLIVDGQLKYFQAPDKLELKGTISLTGADIAAEEGSTIAIRYGNSAKQDRVLRTGSIAEQTRWVTELQRASLSNATSRRTTVAARPAGAASTPEATVHTTVLHRLQELSLTVQVHDGRDLHTVCSSAADQEFWALALLQLAISKKSETSAIQFLSDVASVCFHAHILLGVLKARRGQVEQAQAHFRELADSHQIGSVYACMHLGSLLYEENDCVSAVRYFELSDQHAGGTNAEVLRHWARALQKQDRLDLALDKIQQVLDIDPFDADAYLLLGELAVSSGDLDSAVEHFSSAAKHSPQAAWAHVNLGLILEQQGKLSKAVEQYEAACALDPLMETAHANAAAALQERDAAGDFKASLNHYSALVSLCPGSIEYRSQLCHALMLCGELKRAGQQVLSLEGAFPANHKVKFVRGKLCEQQWLAEVPDDVASSEFPFRSPAVNLQQLRAAEAAYLDAAAQPECPTATLMHLCVVQRKLGNLSAAENTLDLIEARVMGSQCVPRQVAAGAGQTLGAAAGTAEARSRLSMDSVQLQRDLLERQKATSTTFESVRGAMASVPGTTETQLCSGPVSGGGRRESLMLSPLSIDWKPSGGSAQSRSEDFFKTLRKQKQLEAAAKRQELEARVKSLPTEDQERICAEEAAQEEHSKKQERMIRSQLKAYGSGHSVRSLGRGRGRGRGRGGKR